MDAVQEWSLRRIILVDVVDLVGQRWSTEPDDHKQACGGILDGILHVLAKVTHPSGLNGRADRRSCVRGSVSQANCRDIGGRYREFKRIGSGYKIWINDEATRACYARWRVPTNTSADKEEKIYTKQHIVIDVQRSPV